MVIDTEYKKIQEEQDKSLRKEYWDVAIGLNAVDSLKPSSYFKELVEENINGNNTNYDIELAIKEYYKEKLSRQKINESEQQCDMVSLRIKELLEDNSFTFSPVSLKTYHKYLFKDVFDFAGNYRTYNISKDEIILNNDTVKYANYFMIKETLDYDFNEEREIDYSEMTIDEQIDRLVEFTSRIWQVHPFGEGNTRTTAVFIEKYLISKGYAVSNEPFKEHSLFFRNALVRANYSNYPKHVYPDTKYLKKFFENLLKHTNHRLRNRDLIVSELFQ